MKRAALALSIFCFLGAGCKNSTGSNTTIIKTVYVTDTDTGTDTKTTTSPDTTTATGTATATAANSDAGPDGPVITCGTAPQDAGIALNCPPGQVIVAVNFASYGNPIGACPAGTSTPILDQVANDAGSNVDAAELAAIDAVSGEAAAVQIDAGAYDASRSDAPQTVIGKDASIADVSIVKANDAGNATLAIGSCNAVNSLATAETVCLGKSSCTIGADNASFGGDPCPATAKSAAVQVTCGASSTAKTCGQAYQKPCGDYAIVLVSTGSKSPLDRTKLRCAPGVRLDNVVVMVNDTSTITGIPWCQPCDQAANTTGYTTPCANLNLVDASYNKCIAFTTVRTTSATEICDGLDNDCNGLIDDAAAVTTCQKQGAAYRCMPISGNAYNASSCQCAPDCTNKACGASDGCGGICKTGSCASGVCQQSSTGTYSCVCTPNCSQAKCGGSDGCGKTCTGTCQSGASCYLNNVSNYICSDTNVCTGVACGIMGSAGLPCPGTCPAGNSCGRTNTNDKTAVPTYACACASDCTANSCGAVNSCGGVCKYCSAPGATCVQTSGAWSCCTPSCSGKTCGASNDCGGTCATGSGCITPCTPSCSGKTCGDNGCGGSCGSCTNALDTCVSGVCKQTLCYNSGGYCTSDAQCCAGSSCCIGTGFGTYANTCNCANQ